MMEYGLEPCTVNPNHGSANKVEVLEWVSVSTPSSKFNCIAALSELYFLAVYGIGIVQQPYISIYRRNELFPFKTEAISETTSIFDAKKMAERMAEKYFKEQMDCANAILKVIMAAPTVEV